MKQELQTISKTSDLLFDTGMFDALAKISGIMAKGASTIPKHLQGNQADCMAIAMQATQWGMNPFAVAQKTHLVNGALGYEAQLVNAVISSSKAIKGKFKYEWGGSGNDRFCKAGAILAGEESITWGQPVVFGKQTVKNSPLWKTDPDQQLAYLAVKKWARLYTPDVIMGVYTPDELDTVHEKNMGEASVVELEPKSKVQSIKNKLSKSDKKTISLDDVLFQIKRSTTKEELNSAVDMALSLDDCDKDIARKAFTEKNHEIESIQKVDTDTGEVIESAQNEVSNNDDVLSNITFLIDASTTTEELDTACDMIKDLPKKSQAEARKHAVDKRKFFDEAT